MFCCFVFSLFHFCKSFFYYFCQKRDICLSKKWTSWQKITFKYFKYFLFQIIFFYWAWRLIPDLGNSALITNCIGWGKSNLNLWKKACERTLRFAFSLKQCLISICISVFFLLLLQSEWTKLKYTDLTGYSI